MEMVVNSFIVIVMDKVYDKIESWGFLEGHRQVVGRIVCCVLVAFKVEMPRSAALILPCERSNFPISSNLSFQYHASCWKSSNRLNGRWILNCLVEETWLLILRQKFGNFGQFFWQLWPFQQSVRSPCKIALFPSTAVKKRRSRGVSSESCGGV